MQDSHLLPDLDRVLGLLLWASAYNVGYSISVFLPRRRPSQLRQSPPDEILVSSHRLLAPVLRRISLLHLGKDRAGLEPAPRSAPLALPLGDRSVCPSIALVRARLSVAYNKPQWTALLPSKLEPRAGFEPAPPDL